MLCALLEDWMWWVHFLACGLGLYLFTSINAKPMYYISFTQEQFVQKSKQRSKEPILHATKHVCVSLVPCLQASSAPAKT